jgi:hypothetical protein
MALLCLLACLMRRDIGVRAELQQPPHFKSVGLWRLLPAS